jgi:hypothetical protein
MDSPEVLLKKRGLVKYWLDQIKRAGSKIPLKKWENAETRLCAKEKDSSGRDKLPVVNDLRNHYESSRAYLDQREASFKILPASQFMSDEISLKQAECDRVYLGAVWREQEIQIQQSRKLDSSLLRNVGCTMPYFDTKKWMPAVKYINPKDVRIDPDCNGIIEDARWWSYRQFQTMLEFRANHPEIKSDDLKLIRERGESNLTIEEKEKVGEGELDNYTLVCIWHVFAKNSAALINKVEDIDKPDMNESIAEQLKMDTPTRYIQVADGYSKPLFDGDWPFMLDHNEHILTLLTMNKEPDSIYGFTDFEQMERMDLMKDDVMSYIELDAFLSSVRKWLGGEDLPDEVTVNEFLNKTRTSVLPKMLDEQGKPKLVEVSLRQPNQAIVGQYELMHNEALKASGQSELMADTMADFKEVTAIGVRFQEQKLHQRVNLRLGGPRGYEKSIQEDAVKILEIAHQLVPKYSRVLVKVEMPNVNLEQGEIVTDETETIQELPWEQAQQAIRNGGKIVKLGVDAIVGAELAEFWRTLEDTSLAEIRLSTRVSVIPGSTRSITSEQQSEELSQMFLNILWPTIYQPMARIDLAKRFIQYIGRLKGIDDMDDFLPQDSEIGQFVQMTQQQSQQGEQEGQMQQQEMQNQQMMADKDAQGKDLDIARERAKAQMELETMSAKNEMDLQKQKMAVESARAKNANV